MNFNQPATILIIASIISLVLSVYAWSKRQNSTGIYLSLLLLSAAVWSLFYGLEIFSSNMVSMKIYLFVSYFGITSLPVFWLLFALRYSESEKWINKYSLILLFTIPVLSIIMQLTNHLHSLFYKSVTLGEVDNIKFLKLEHGIFWWINITYSHVVTIAGVVLFVHLMFKLEKGQRIPILFFITGALIPYIVNVLYIAGIRPYGFLDLTPVAFILMGIVIIFGVFTVKLFDINPLAVDFFFRNTPDIIFVRNSQGKIVNKNPAAQHLIDDLEKLNTGNESNCILDEMIFNETPGLSELKINEKYYEKTVTEIGNRKGVNVGTLILLRDISKAKEVQEEIEKLINLQNLLMRMASNYINFKIENIEEGINQSLREIGSYAEADRAYIFDYDWEKNTCSNTYEWCAEGISKEIDNLQDVPVSYIPDWTGAHKNGEPLIIPDVYQLPEDNAIRQILEPQSIKSLITIPVMQKNHCRGFIGFDFVKKHRVINENESTLLSVYAEILVNLISRVSLENNLIKEKVNANAANKAKSEFLANMSHEIRTPMNSILGFSEILLKTTQNEQQTGYLNIIVESGRNLLSLINDILDLSKIEAGKLEILQVPTDIRILVKEMENLFSHKMEEKNLAFHIEIEDDFPEIIMFDELRLRQILLNLIGNAVKFTQHGFIKIQVNLVKKQGKTIDFQIKVRDTGIGISSKKIESLFDAFIQESSEKNRKYEGTGLGLAITKRLVELMNGEISVTSKHGKGSCFTVNFTNILLSNKKVIENKDSKSERKLKFKNQKVLVVDDIKHNRTLILNYLHRLNINVIEAENGVEAVEKCLSEKPDLVLMDIRMPKMDGFQATAKIKETAEIASIPVIALTASVLDDDMQKITTSFDSYLSKPVIKKTLLEELLKFLSHDEHIIENKIIPGQVDELKTKEEISSEVKLKFNNLFLNEISNNLKSIIIDEFQELIQRMDNFADEHSLTQLKENTKNLARFIDDFDFENIKSELIKVSKIFKK